MVLIGVDVATQLTAGARRNAANSMSELARRRREYDEVTTILSSTGSAR
jgi:hypothetical protein